MQKYRYSFIAPVAVFFILMSVFFCYQMFPFGNKTLAWCDMEQQVIPFLMDFKDILAGKSNMFLNLQNAGGMSFWGVFLFFISSPFTFLVAFIQKGDMYHFVNILILLKMMVCSLTASLFFIALFKKLSIAQTTALSVMYAFSGYAMFYYQNQVWLDIMYLFPILLLGLNKLVKEEKIWLYVISFSAFLTVNFYLSYMITLFIVLAFGFYLFFNLPRNQWKTSIFLLGIASIIVAFITAVIWIPSLMQYLASARTGDLITSLKIGGFFTRFDTTLTVLICTSAIFAACILYALFYRQYLKQNPFLFFIFLLMLIPVIIEPINKMWHTGNYQAFPVRYGYITIFIGLMLLAIILSQINSSRMVLYSSPYSVFCCTLAVSMLFVVSCLLIRKKYEAITVYTRTLWGNSESFKLLFAYFIISAFSYLIILVFYQSRQLKTSAFSIFLCLLVLIEAVFNSCVYIASPAKLAEKYQSVISLSDKIKDTELYRVKMKEKYFDANLIGSLGYQTLSHYTSLTNESFMYTMKKLGYSSYWMEVSSNGGTELTDAILGNRYSIVRSSPFLGKDNLIYQNNSYSIIKNNNTLPIGFVMNSSRIKSLEKLPDEARLKMQENLYESVFNTDNKLFTFYEPNELQNISYRRDGSYLITYPDNSINGILTYRIPVKGTQTLYFDCFDRISNSLVEHINSSFNILVNGTLIQDDYPNQSNNGLVNLGTFTDQTVEVQVEVLKEVYAKSFGIAGLDINRLKEAVNSTAAASLKQVNHKLEGNVDTGDRQDAYLFLPLTYDGGYSATVNDKNAQIYKVFDCMMAVKLEKGANTISVSYIPPGFKTGAVISVFGFLLFFVALKFCNKKSLEKLKRIKNISALLFLLLFVGTIFMVYIFPVYIYLKK